MCREHFATILRLLVPVPAMEVALWGSHHGTLPVCGVERLVVSRTSSVQAKGQERRSQCERFTFITHKRCDIDSIKKR